MMDFSTFDWQGLLQDMQIMADATSTNPVVRASGQERMRARMAEREGNVAVRRAVNEVGLLEAEDGD